MGGYQRWRFLELTGQTSESASDVMKQICQNLSLYLCLEQLMDQCANKDANQTNIKRQPIDKRIEITYHIMIHVHTMFLLVFSMVIIQWYFCFLVLLVLYLLPAHLSTSQVEHHDGTIPWYNRVTPPTTAATDVIVPAGRWANWTDWPDVTVRAVDADRVTPVGATKAMDAMVALAKERKSREIKWVGAKMAEVDKLLWSSRSKWTCKNHLATKFSKRFVVKLFQENQSSGCFFFKN